MRKHLLIFSLTIALGLVASSSASRILINEIHYDNAGGDVGEFVEIGVPAGTALMDVTVTLYNGSGGAMYNSATADTFTAGSTGVIIGGSPHDLFVWNPSSIQNGAPDGLAVDLAGSPVEFLSYEGSFSATDGAASGTMSTDIGVAETSGSPIGGSLQLIAGTWTVTDADTSGAANAVPEPATISLLMLSLGTLLLRRRK